MKLIKRLNRLLKDSKDSLPVSAKELKKVLKKLKHKSRDLAQQLAHCQSEEEKTVLQEKLEIIHCKQQKVLSLLQTIDKQAPTGKP